MTMLDTSLTLRRTHEARCTGAAGVDSCVVDANEASLQLLGLQSCAHRDSPVAAGRTPERQPDGRLSAERATEVLALALERGACDFVWTFADARGAPVDAEVRLTAITVDGQSRLHLIRRNVAPGRGNITNGDTAFNAGRLVDDVRRAMSGRADVRRLWLEMDHDPMLATLNVFGDELRIRQVLVNFLSNAIEFTQEGGVCLRSEIVLTEPDRVRFRFEVIDTGIGMPGEQVLRLQELFAPGAAAAVRGWSDNGRGLAVNRRLVELLDGRMGVSCVPGMGCTFWFEVTLRRCFDELPAALDDAELPVAARVGGTDAARRGTRPIDREIGLKYAAGRPDLYERVLGRFRDLHRADHDVLRRALAAEDRASAQRLLHSLKSVAALIGANGLRDEAIRLEKRCIEGAACHDLALDLDAIGQQVDLVAADIVLLRDELRLDALAHVEH